MEIVIIIVLAVLWFLSYGNWKTKENELNTEIKDLEERLKLADDNNDIQKVFDNILDKVAKPIVENMFDKKDNK